MSEAAADDLDFGRSEPPAADEPQPFAGFAPVAPGPVAHERTISPIAGRFGLGKGGKAIAVLGLAAGCGVFLAATWTHPRGRRPSSGPQEPARQVVDWASVKAPSRPVAASASQPPSTITAPAGASILGGAVPSSPSLAFEPPGQVVPALSAADDAPPTAGGSSSAAGADPKAAARQVAAIQAANLQAIRAAPLLAYSADVRGDAGVPAPPSPAKPSEAEAATELDQLRRGSAIGQAFARRLADRDFLLTAGALLPCVLETALDTSAPGFVTCRLIRDVYSDTGGVVLLEKGSRAVGEYRSGFQQGRARIFVLWDRITTPSGVAVDVRSPATDALGRAGFDGAVDSHFWRRFGGALLLTTVGGGVSAAATADARFANVAQAPNEAASVALQNSINIPPTLTKPQGSEVAIFVSRDLDFSTVYALRSR